MIKHQKKLIPNPDAQTSSNKVTEVGLLTSAAALTVQSHTTSRADGAEDGTAEFRAPDGAEDGTADAEVGTSDGAKVGTADGAKVGTADGAKVGALLGAAVLQTPLKSNV